jgi:hypothetical protein
MRDDHSYEGITLEQRSIRNAQARPKTINRVLSLVSVGLFLQFRSVQRWFYRYDLGDGYVACGVKRSD